MEKFSNVVFADVNLQDAPIREDHLFVGEGGWPTIRYFNKRTGVKGLSYVKKTEEAMCTELGPTNPYMEDFVDAMESGEADNWDRAAQEKEREEKAKLAALRKLTINTKFNNKSHKRLSKSFIHRGTPVFQQTLEIDFQMGDTGRHGNQFLFTADDGCSFTYTNDGNEGVELAVTLTPDMFKCPQQVKFEFINNSGEELKKYFVMPSTTELHFQSVIAPGVSWFEEATETHSFEFHNQKLCVFKYTVVSSKEDHSFNINKDDLVCPRGHEEL